LKLSTVLQIGEAIYKTNDCKESAIAKFRGGSQQQEDSTPGDMIKKPRRQQYHKVDPQV
jgi:hypothetical protein